MKTLIAYYSKSGENWVNGEKGYLETGNSKMIAEHLKEKLNADIFEIKMRFPYPDDYDQCCRKTYEDQKNGIRPELKEDIDITLYDNVIFCFPIYWDSCPMPVLSFLKNKDFTNRKVYLITTHEGSGLGDSKHRMETENNTLHVSFALPIVGSLVKKSMDQVDEFIGKSTDQTSRIA